MIGAVAAFLEANLKDDWVTGSPASVAVRIARVGDDIVLGQLNVIGPRADVREQTSAGQSVGMAGQIAAERLAAIEADTPTLVPAKEPE